MTEDEASTKVCCGPPILHEGNGSGCCVGSSCMAWRWLRYTGNQIVDHGHWTDQNGYAATGEKGNLKPVGFCGLAGSPL